MKIKGLTTTEAEKRLIEYGRNEFIYEKKKGIFKKFIEVIKEPMFLLLLSAAVIYFILGEPRDGAVMLIFVIGVIGIEFVQEWKTDKTLNTLKQLSAPRVTVVRDGKEVKIPSALVVPGDLMLVCEGEKIAADGKIVYCNNLKVDESTLTGESEHIWKTACADIEEKKETQEDRKKNRCYAGTLVTQGTGEVFVTATGPATEYGKIGKAINEAPDRPTPLEKQVSKLVKMCAVIAGILFLAVCLITFINLADLAIGERITKSILSGISLAMAMIPEEFPVILTVFLSMGAWRLAKKKSLVRRLPSVETLGAVSVLCVDKTGTITTNKMQVSEVYSVDDDMVRIMGSACESDAYDPMEKAIISYCREKNEDIFGGELVHDYAFTDEKKMMGHIWKKDGNSVLAVKGSPESVLEQCGGDKSEIIAKADEMASHGLRVLAVAKAEKITEIKNSLDDYSLTFCGLVGLIDPPREGMSENIKTCRNAGIRVVMITGDSSKTALAIAEGIGMDISGGAVHGSRLEDMTDDELCECVKRVNVFSRVMPQHKMRIVTALKKNGEVVAMTGDGVNDAAAMRYADIGIAMGKRGSEVSREAADLILLDDDFSVIVDTVRDGRRIYDNIRKAVGYVFAIHIPIALSSLIGALMGLDTAMMLLPVHVVLLELVIDPTCSIVLERQPEERNVMQRPPRSPKERILTRGTLVKGILQGTAVFAVSFFSYLYFMHCNCVEYARSVGLGIIFMSNLFLVQVNSSDSDLAYVSSKRLADDKIMWAVNIITVIGIAVIMYTPLGGFLKLAPLDFAGILYMMLAAFAAVFWYEGIKFLKILKTAPKK